MKHLKSNAVTLFEQLISAQTSTLLGIGTDDDGVVELSSDLTSHQLTASDCVSDCKTGSRFSALTTCG